VLTTRPREESPDARPASAAAASTVRFRTGRGEPKTADAVLVQETTLSDSLLSSPEEMADQIFTESESPSIVHIPLPGWVWNLAHRKEWLASLNTWGANENAVVLVELPPASTPEGILLAQNLPNVLWLSDTTKATALETRQQLETLRLARCNLVGAVMNRSNGTHLNERFARWVPVPAMAALAIGFMLAPAPAARAQAGEPAADGSFSIVSPAQRGTWQQHLTLGPGDVLRIGIFSEPGATRNEVAVQPDGRITFLEARDVVASGLTIDELRAELDRRLGEFRRAPHTMVSPVAFRSKKYHMLGLVAQKGSFTLDRPMTVVEAVARARGFETGAATGDVMELADLQHAFLVRNGERKPVDFARLFTAGDLSQNIAVEPGDYFYFPPADLREVYVLGEVMHPGPATLAEHSTSLRAVATRGGFTQKAWRGRVLVVRGSLSQPQALVVNLADVLQGKGADVPLEPHDIVYVSARPWWKAEDLLDEAAAAFTQAFVVYWTSDKVIPVVPLQ
jgi:protein involved in polysaccharide export with SLBB domain